MIKKKQWIGIVKWTKEAWRNKYKHMGSYEPTHRDLLEYFGPFDKYDTVVKTWAMEFGKKHKGEYEWIDNAELIKS